MASIQDQVRVVGAGPTGLALAVELTRLGVRCRVIDKEREPCPLSRALGLQARTLEIIERLGIAEEAIAPAGRFMASACTARASELFMLGLIILRAGTTMS